MSLTLAIWADHLQVLCFFQVQIGKIISLLEKAMATHSGTLALKIPWTEGPGRLQSRGSPRVGQD